MDHLAENFCSNVPCKKCEHSGLCEHFLQGAVGQKDQQDDPLIYGCLLSSNEGVRRISAKEVMKNWPVTVGLVVLNGLIFFLVMLIGGPLMEERLITVGAAYTPSIQDGQWYRLVTSMFLHFDGNHLASNMLVLGVLGSRLEKLLGPLRFLMIYLLGGIGGNLFSMAYSAGASGAVFALTGAMLALAILGRGRAGDLTVKQVLVMSALSLYLGFADKGVNNEAHVGGFVCGLAMAAIMDRAT